MYLQQLALHQFRNFQEVAAIEFPPRGFLVAAAPNATGKTNFIEGIMVLLRGRSWRAGVEECVQWGADSFVVQGVVGGGGVTSAVAVRYVRPTQRVRIEVDGEPVSPVLFYARYPVVLFLPEDTFLLTRGPAARRTFLNQVLVAVPAYMSALVQYHRVLRQRNAQLKVAPTAEAVGGWTELLVEHGEVVWQHRLGLAQFLNQHLTEMYERLTDERLALTVRLRSGTPQPERLRDHLASLFAEERRLGFTLAGPHRDDLVVSAYGQEASLVLSRGQSRGVVTALKVLTHTYLTTVTGEEPLLLLDDVLSELDERRQAALVRHLPDTQTLLTATVLPQVLPEREGVHLLDLKAIIAAPRRRAEAAAVAAPEPEAAVAVPA